MVCAGHGQQEEQIYDLQHLRQWTEDQRRGALEGPEGGGQTLEWMVLLLDVTTLTSGGFAPAHRAMAT